MKSDGTNFLNRSERLTSENLLWVSVIMMAIHDARIEFNDIKIYDAPDKRIGPKFRVTDKNDYAISKLRLSSFYRCIEARLWFEKREDEFELVCMLAGLEKDYVYRMYRKVLEDDDIDPVIMLKQFMKE